MSFKSMFNQQAIEILGSEISKVYKAFDKTAFVKSANTGINKLELKDRVDKIAKTLILFMPDDFKESARIIAKSLAPINKDKHISSFEETKTITGFLIWPLTTYTQMAGMNNFKESMKLLCDLTQRFSSEFAIRAFIDKYQERAYKEIFKWASHSNFHIRRLATEGTRPTLPWGQKVNYIHENLELNCKLLKGMEKDVSEYVRKSVANHLNDISKLDRDLFFKHIKSFDSKCAESNWVKRHAMRTLLKAADPMAMKEYGYSPSFKIKTKLRLLKKSIKEGESLPIDLQITNTQKPFKALIEYKVYYMKSNGKLMPKVFRLRDTLIESGLELKKDISFKKVTTRKHYPGVHRIEIIINGKAVVSESFKLACN